MKRKPAAKGHPAKKPSAHDSGPMPAEGRFDAGSPTGRAVDDEEFEGIEGVGFSEADEDHWEVFVLDDDSEPLPDFGDFWIPD